MKRFYICLILIQAIVWVSLSVFADTNNQATTNNFASVETIKPFADEIEFFSMSDTRVIGKTIRCPLGENVENPIPAFWGDFFDKGYNKALIDLPKTIPNSYLGWTGDYDSETNTFIYMVGVLTPKDTPVPEGFEYYDLPASVTIKGLYGEGLYETLDRGKEKGYEWNHCGWNAELYLDEEEKDGSWRWFTAVKPIKNESEKKAEYLKKWTAKFSGFAQLREYFNPHHTAYGVADRVALDFTLKSPDKQIFYTSLYYHPYLKQDRVKYYLESLYYEIPVDNGSKVRLGKGRNQNFGVIPTYSNRLTTQYGILSETFTQDRIIGAQVNGKINDNLLFGFSMYMNPKIRARAVGSSPVAEHSTSIPHFAERDDPYNENGDPAMGLKITSNIKNNLTASLSGAFGNLRDDDVNYINSQYGIDENSTTYYKYGADVIWKNPKFNLIGEAYYGRYSTLGILGLGASANYTLNKYGTKVAAKYNYMNYNKKPIFDNPITWEPSQLILGISHPLGKQLLLEFNYEFNMERGGSISNDLAFIECMVSF